MSAIDDKIRELLESSTFISNNKQMIPEDYRQLSDDELEEFIATDDFESLDEDDKLAIAAYVYKDEFIDYLDHIDEEDLEDFIGSKLFESMTESMKTKIRDMFKGKYGNKDEFTGEYLNPSAMIQKPKKRKAKNESIDMSSEIAALVEGESLTEEFKQKAAVIFESAVLSRVKQEIKLIEEEYETKLEEQAVDIRNSIVEKVDDYLNYVVDQWITENKLAVENGLKIEIMESFMTGMKSLFEQHYIEIPEDKLDTFEDLANRLTVTEKRMNEQFETNIDLRRQLTEMRKTLLIKNITEGMTTTDADKLLELAEDLSYSSDESFISKLKTIKESYFETKKPKTISYGSPVSSSPIEYLDESTEYHSPAMEQYLKVLTRSNNV